MKTLVTLSLLFASLVVTAPARAANGIGHWEGSGTTFDIDGKELGDFTVTVDRAAVDEHTVDVRGNVTLADGKTFAFTERQFENGNAFRIESPRGNGGGRCFGAGLCQSYKDLGDGKGEATSIVVDSADKLRVLVTELEQGRATRFVRQTLTRKQ